MGIAVPRHFEKDIALRRALKAKQNETAKWGFCSRDREGPWLYYIEYPLVFYTEVARGKRFYSEWLIIDEGKIIVNPGHSEVDSHDNKLTVTYLNNGARTYAFDGCSPKIVWWWFLVIGTPDLVKKEYTTTMLIDGQEQQKQRFWNIAIHAALVHDALYQYLHVIPIQKADLDRLFKEMLINQGVPSWLAQLYYLAVSVMAGRDVPKHHDKPNTQIERQ